jgi:uncharacterized iron-regulated membrane protein
MICLGLVIGIISIHGLFFESELNLVLATLLACISIAALVTGMFPFLTRKRIRLDRNAITLPNGKEIAWKDVAAFEVVWVSVWWLKLVRTGGEIRLRDGKKIWVHAM